MRDEASYDLCPAGTIISTGPSESLNPSQGLTSYFTGVAREAQRGLAPRTVTQS